MLLSLFCYLKKNSSNLKRFWDIDYPLSGWELDKEIYTMRCDMLIKLKAENVSTGLNTLWVSWVFMDLLH